MFWRWAPLFCLPGLAYSRVRGHLSTASELATGASVKSQEWWTDSKGLRCPTMATAEKQSLWEKDMTGPASTPGNSLIHCVDSHRIQEKRDNGLHLEQTVCCSWQGKEHFWNWGKYVWAGERERVCVCVYLFIYGWITLLCIWNIVDQLFFDEKNK